MSKLLHLNTEVLKQFPSTTIFLFVGGLGLSGCATSDPVLWPPAPNAPTKDIYVSLDTWHAMIGFQADMRQDEVIVSRDSNASSSGPEPMRFEEWGYAEHEWYLEGRHGFTGVLRALFWPSEGVVEVAKYDQLWANRTPQPPSDLFKFELSEDGYARLRSHLHSTRESSKPLKVFKKSNFYQSTASYHVFHHCHQYVARALQTAGLPVSAFWSITRTSLASQLREVQESVEEK